MAKITYSNEWLSIANRALALVTSQTLQSFDDGTPAATFVNNLLPGAIEAVYADLPFDDISVIRELPTIADEPKLGDGWKAFAKPQELTKLREVITNPAGRDWRLMRDYIASNCDSLVIRYVVKPSTPDDMPAYARTLAVLKLGSYLAGPVGHNESLQQTLENSYQNQLSSSLTLQAQSRMQPDYANTTFWTAGSEVDE